MAERMNCSPQVNVWSDSSLAEVWRREELCREPLSCGGDPPPTSLASCIALARLLEAPAKANPGHNYLLRWASRDSRDGWGSLALPGQPLMLSPRRGEADPPFPSAGLNEQHRPLHLRPCKRTNILCVLLGTSLGSGRFRPISVWIGLQNLRKFWIQS